MAPATLGSIDVDPWQSQGRLDFLKPKARSGTTTATPPVAYMSSTSMVSAYMTKRQRTVAPTGLTPIQNAHSSSCLRQSSNNVPSPCHCEPLLGSRCKRRLSDALLHSCQSHSQCCFARSWAAAAPAPHLLIAHIIQFRGPRRRAPRRFCTTAQGPPSAFDLASQAGIVSSNRLEAFGMCSNTDGKRSVAVHIR